VIFNKRAFMIAAAVAGLGVSASALAQIQGYPNRPITMIVPYPAGGATDIQIRSVSLAASRHLGQPIVIVNKPGAGGAMGAITLASSPADGYTLSQVSVGVFRQPHITKMPYDPATLSYVIGVSGYLFGAAVRADAPWKSFEELLNYAKAHPGKVKFGSIGNGSVQHTTMEAVAAQRGIEWLHVPYKGNSEVNLALLSGQIDFSSDGSAWAPLIDAGKLRLMAVYGENRAKKWPDAPTLKELGFNISERSPYGIAGPAGMDPAITAVLHEAFKKALNDPEHLRTLANLNQEVVYMSSEDFTAHARSQSQVQADIVKRYGLKQN
jgi:tripartite-type tricarboxylate transporter receptor subunit TctC